MTHKLRKFLLNEQIASEARRIAHAATQRCWGRRDPPGSGEGDEWHTPACNKLKHDIEALALQVKLAASQRPEPKPAQGAAFTCSEVERAGAT